MTISWALVKELRATSYTISYSNTNNTQCFTDSDNITGIAASDTVYELTNLQEDTEYSITVIALLSDGNTRENSVVSTIASAGLCAYKLELIPLRYYVTIKFSIILYFSAICYSEFSECI